MGHLCRWRLGGIRSYNPEQIMLSAAVHRTSRDVSIMKEKLIFSGGQRCKLRQAVGSVISTPTCTRGCVHASASNAYRQGHSMDIHLPTQFHMRPPHAVINSRSAVSPMGGGQG